MSEEPTIRVNVKVEAWAQPAEGVSMYELIDTLRQLGHEIIAIEWAARRVKVLYREQELG